jgi:hypothetical protein
MGGVLAASIGQRPFMVAKFGGMDGFGMAEEDEAAHKAKLARLFDRLEMAPQRRTVQLSAKHFRLFRRWAIS